MIDDRNQYKSTPGEKGVSVVQLKPLEEERKGQFAICQSLNVYLTFMVANLTRSWRFEMKNLKASLEEFW